MNRIMHIINIGSNNGWVGVCAVISKMDCNILMFIIIDINMHY